MTCQRLDKRIKSLEDSSLQQKTQISKLKNDHDQIREKVSTIQKDMIKIKYDFSSDINKQINRYQRRLNLLLLLLKVFRRALVMQNSVTY